MSGQAWKYSGLKGVWRYMLSYESSDRNFFNAVG